MGIKYSFVDNLTYGTDDINDITRNLTGAGVAPFLTKNSYTADDLNGLTEAVVSGGAQLGGCKVPWEVIKPPYFTVSLFCGDLITANVLSVGVERSGMVDGEVPSAPTPTIWQTYIERLKKAFTDALSAATETA